MSLISPVYVNPDDFCDEQTGILSSLNESSSRQY